MAGRKWLPIRIEQDCDDNIFIQQSGCDTDDIIIMSPATALLLAYRLMAFAKGQGPREETIEPPK